MKQLKTYINEAFMPWNAKVDKYTEHPKTLDELKNIIQDRIDKEGNECDLNDIDVSAIDNMDYVFQNTRFNEEISEWDVNPICITDKMFEKCHIKEEYKPKGICE